MKICIRIAIMLLLLNSLHGCFVAERDNVDDPKSASYKISANVIPGNMETISAHEDIVIQFTDSMDVNSIVIGGDIILTNIRDITGTTAWSNRNFVNDTLTISIKDSSTAAFWPKGKDKKLTISGKTASGMQLAPVTITYDIIYSVYVSTTGDPLNIGNRSHPINTIKAAISRAQILYGTSPSEVHVETGVYPVNWGSNTNRIVMVEGISLYGGYSINFTQHDAASYVTTIVDQSTTSGTIWTNPNRAIDFSSPAITNATVLDGFTITGGGSAANGNAAGVFCYSGASPTIQNNIINGSTLEYGNTFGIISSSSPLIQKNIITGGKGKVSAGAGNGDSYGIYSDTQSGILNSPVIKNNTISGGNGYNSYGVIISSGNSPKIHNNKISGGDAKQVSNGIWIYISITCEIFNNLIFGGSGGFQTYGIYTGSVPVKIFNNTIDGGRSSSPTPDNLYCIYIADSALPEIMNNILFLTDYSSSLSKRFGIYEGAALTLTSMKNNVIYGTATNSCSGALYHDTSGNITNIATINGWGGGYSGNINVFPVFVNYSSSVLWTSGDLHLTAATDSGITSGGLDGAGLGWGFTTDMDNVTRTPGWSMGAYEYN